MALDGFYLYAKISAPMKYYELLYIIPATEDWEATSGHVESVVKAQEMEILRHEEAGRFRLAYPMRHVRQGVYRLMVFRGEPRGIFPIETALRLERNVLRAMITASNESALKRPVNLMTFQEPAMPRDARDESVRRSSRPGLRRVPGRVPAMAATAVVAASPSAVAEPPKILAKPMSSDEIDQEIDKILEEKVL